MPSIRTLAIGATAATFACTILASADVIEPGTYLLGNHPDGNAGPPLYGLRLDEVVDVSAGHDVFTFDFDATGADMRLDYDGSSIHIYGTAFGGLDVGSGYDETRSGWVSVDFTYGMTTVVGTDDDLIVDTPDFTNSGAIELWDGTQVDLYDYSGSHGFTFRIGDGDDDAGHRGYEGISAWGWLNYDTTGHHVSATDWLFTATPVPGPGAMALLGLAALVGRRRR